MGHREMGPKGLTALSEKSDKERLDVMLLKTES